MEHPTVQSKIQIKNQSWKFRTLETSEEQNCDLQSAPTELTDLIVQVLDLFSDFLYDPPGRFYDDLDLNVKYDFNHVGASRLYGCATRKEYGPGTDGAEVYITGAPMGPHGHQWGPVGPQWAPWGPNYVKLLAHQCRINRNEPKLFPDLIRPP